MLACLPMYLRGEHVSGLDCRGGGQNPGITISKLNILTNLNPDLKRILVFVRLVLLMKYLGLKIFSHSTFNLMDAKNSTTDSSTENFLRITFNSTRDRFPS